MANTIATVAARKDLSKKVRLNVELTPEVAESLAEMAKHQGVSLSEAVRRSITTEAFLQKKRDAKVKVLLDEGGGILKELVFLR